MQAEDLVLNHCSQGQEVEELRELFPHVGVSVLAQTFVVESVPVIKHIITRCSDDANSDLNLIVKPHSAELACSVTALGSEGVWGRALTPE